MSVHSTAHNAIGDTWRGPPDNSKFGAVPATNATGPVELMVPQYFVMGTISFVLNIFTIYLILRKSAFFSTEIRHLFMNLQVTCTIQNLHFTILFQPILRPFFGGGYCEGLLCSIGVKFHFNFVFMMLSISLILSSFIIILFNREQSLLKPESSFKVRKSAAKVFYLFTYSFLIFPSIALIFYEMPGKDQYTIMVKERIDNMRWVTNDKNWEVNDGSFQRQTWDIIVYVCYADLTLFLAIIMFFVTHISMLAKSSRTLTSSGRKWRYTAKAKNVYIILIQFIAYLLLVALPILIIFKYCSQDDSNSCQNVAEAAISLFSVVNAIIFIIGNKQYKKMLIKRFFNIAVVNSLHSATDSSMQANSESAL